MVRAQVVIGANFGDEGKGLMTDYFASRLGEGTVVCRFNGGAQAGHTVVTPEGARHVFSHFGSGTLAGASTFLSRHFIVNPLLFRKEAQTLREVYPHPPVVYVDSRALITTPFDMLINQAVENSRGTQRHGSCGVGINETVVRSITMPLSVETLCGSEVYVRQALHSIYEDYVPVRLAELGLPLDVTLGWPPLYGLVDKYLEARSYFLDSVTVERRPDELLHYSNIVFEGAQGLLLDQDHYFFPHVTRSSTGLTNVLDVASEAGIDALDVTYVTRSYFTRHGSGPFPTEDATFAFPDDTNVQGPWQGQLRFGHFDPHLLVRTVLEDFQRKTDVELGCRLAVTHMDQLELPGTLLDHVAAEVGAAGVYLSYGPTRHHVSSR